LRNKKAILTLVAGTTVLTPGKPQTCTGPDADIIAAEGNVAPDPIYAAIERHKQTVAIFGAATSARGRFPDFRTRMNDEQKKQLELLDEAVEAGRPLCVEAARDLIYTEPTTMAGIIAAIQYIQIHVHNGGEFMPRDIESDSPAELAWIQVFLEAIADALSSGRIEP
jgi:hypothetical protein